MRKTTRRSVHVGRSPTLTRLLHGSAPDRYRPPQVAQLRQQRSHPQTAGPAASHLLSDSKTEMMLNKGWIQLRAKRIFCQIPSTKCQDKHTFSKDVLTQQVHGERSRNVYSLC